MAEPGQIEMAGTCQVLTFGAGHARACLPKFPWPQSWWAAAPSYLKIFLRPVPSRASPLTLAFRIRQLALQAVLFPCTSDNKAIFVSLCVFLFLYKNIISKFKTSTPIKWVKVLKCFYQSLNLTLPAPPVWGGSWQRNQVVRIRVTAVETDRLRLLEG